MILFDIGLQNNFAGIIIPALSGLKNEYNQNETLSFGASEASWLGEYFALKEQ